MLCVVGEFVTCMVGKFSHSLGFNVCHFRSSEKLVSLTPFYEEYSEAGLELSLLGYFI